MSGPCLEIPAPDHSKVSVPVCSRATTSERCPSLVSSQEITEGELLFVLISQKISSAMTKGILDQSWQDILIVNDCSLKSDGVVVSNASLSTQALKKGTYLGKAAAVNLIEVDTGNGDHGVAEEGLDESSVVKVAPPNECITWQKQELRKLLKESFSSEDLSMEDMDRLLIMMEQYYVVFSLEDGEQGETSLVEFCKDTGESVPIKQAACRVPFSTRQEIVTQLRKMEEGGVIQQSQSPWAIPVVLVRKCDDSLQFCVDYRSLNSVTKLQRIDNLLDKLGQSKYFRFEIWLLAGKNGCWKYGENSFCDLSRIV